MTTPHVSRSATSDISLHSRVYGSGEPLLLLHGNGEDHTYFEHQIPFLSRFFEVHAIDTREHGQSERGEKPFTIGQFARDMITYLDEHNLPAAHVLGFSDGANIAMLMGMNWPQRISSLVLDGGNLDLSGIQARYRLQMKALDALLPDIRPLRKTRDLLALMTRDPMIRREDLQSISAPTLVMAGSRDVILPEHTRLMAQNIPHASLSIVQGDHFIARDNPGTFNHQLMNFYRKIGVLDHQEAPEPASIH